MNEPRYPFALHNAYGLVLGEHNTVTQVFTEGISALPTDYAARIQNFLTEYLGTTRRPVPFGGRETDLASLDAWLDNPDVLPYLLLVAPAGRGKSALLVRWSQRLLARSDLAVIFLPISIRFRTNLASVVFSSLIARLAILHGEKLQVSPDTPLEHWRGLLTDYLNRPLPDGRHLILILDGIDETADWEVGSDLFPFTPPQGLRIVLSARYLAGDADVSAWLRRVGWSGTGLAQSLDLRPLTQEGVADVLKRMSFPLDRLGAQADIVTELHRLSEGDPLLVRLYVDDLWKQEEKANRLRPEDLQDIRPGLQGYFTRWWEDQRGLWGNQTPLREPAVQELLDLLACALGPLSQEDVLRLAAPDIRLTNWTLEEDLHPLKRFVIGDGRQLGYSFTHPRLGAYFYEERFNTRRRSEIESRFLIWGKETCTALNEGHLLPEQASSYIVQYYGAHLTRTKQGTEAFLALVSNGWKRAWEQLEGTHAGFLTDVEKAWRAVENENSTAIKAGHLAPYIGNEVGCTLCFSSINSMAKKIPTVLLERVVEKGIWNPTQGLAYARYMPDVEQRAIVLVRLSHYLSEPLKSKVIQEALLTVQQSAREERQARMLAAMLPHLPERQREEVVREMLLRGRAIKNDESRTRTLLAIIPYLQGTLKGEVIEEVLLPVLPGRTDTRGEAFLTMLIVLLPHLSDDLLQETLAVVQAIQKPEERALTLSILSTRLPEELKSIVAQEAFQLIKMNDEQEDREIELAFMAPYLTENQLQKTLEDAKTVSESQRARVVALLFPYLTDELKSQGLEIAESISREENRAFALASLSPYLTDELQQQVVEAARTINKMLYRTAVLSALIPRLPAHLQSEVLHDSLQAIQFIDDEEMRVWVLAELIPHLNEEMLREALEATLASTIGDERDRAEVLVALAPYLPEPLLLDSLRLVHEMEQKADQAWTTVYEGARVKALLALAPFLPKTLHQDALEATQAIEEETARVAVLKSLIPRLSGKMLLEVWSVVRAIRKEDARASLLIVLIPLLPEELLQEVLRVTLAIHDDHTEQGC